MKWMVLAAHILGCCSLIHGHIWTADLGRSTSWRLCTQCASDGDTTKWMELSQIVSVVDMGKMQYTV